MSRGLQTRTLVQKKISAASSRASWGRYERVRGLALPRLRIRFRFSPRPSRTNTSWRLCRSANMDAEKECRGVRTNGCVKSADTTPVRVPVHVGAGSRANRLLERVGQDVRHPAAHDQVPGPAEEVEAGPLRLGAEALGRAPRAAGAHLVAITLVHRDGERDDAVGLVRQVLQDRCVREDLEAVEVPLSLEEEFAVVERAFGKGEHPPDQGVV